MPDFPLNREEEKMKVLKPSKELKEELEKENFPQMQLRSSFSTGAQRGTSPPVRYDLLSPIAMRRWAETCHEGADKYGVGNALLGIPCSNLLNHAMVHLEKWRSGDRTEDHLAHAFWNISMIMHFEETNPKMLDPELIYKE